MELPSLSKGEIVGEKVVITSEEQSPTTHSSIEEWIQTFGSEKNIQKGTFVDTDGVSRFVDNWRAVTVASPASRTCEEFATTGCMTVPIMMPMSSKGTTGNQVRFVNFMLNFRTFWNHNEKDNVDELTDYSPLFRVYIELFFHKRTVQIMMALSLYSLTALVVSDTVYTIYPPISRAIDYFSFCLPVYVYFALVVLFKGSLFPKGTKTTGGQQQQTGSNNKENRGNYYRSKESLNWMFYLKEALQLSANEIIRLSHKAVGGETRGQDRGAQKRIPFYETLNVGLKFLTKHSEHTGVKLDLNRPVYNNKLLLIFFAIPVYELMVTFYAPIGPYQTYMRVCNLDGVDSVYCNHFRLVFISTLGYTVPMTVKILFISSVLLSLVGLSFGAEIGCALVDSWILRFGSLRTLKMKGGVAGDIEEGGACRTERLTVAASFKNQRQQQAASTSAQTAVVNALHSNGASSPAMNPSAGEISKSLVPAADTCHAQSPELYIYLQRDSYEHYLYVREFMAISSRAWSFTIIAFLFMACFFIMLFMYGSISSVSVITSLEWTYYAFWVSIRLSLLSVFPIVSLARANAYVYALQEQFLVAAPEDFAVIGGRDSWLEYLDKVPAMWTIYGVNVTWDRLNGLLWAGLAGIGAIAISSLANG